MNRRSISLGTILALTAATLVLSGCDEKPTAAKAGEQVDKAVEKAGEGVGDALNKAGDAVKDATKN